MSVDGVRTNVDADRVQALVAGIQGVRSVDMSGYPQKITLKCDAAGLRSFAAETIRARVKEEVGAEPEIRVDVSAAQTARTRRARFESVSITSAEYGRINARVVLEWQRQQFVGESDGEASAAGELRACAIATMRAVEKVAAEEITFSLVGAKELHVFDHDLIAVLLHSPQLPEHRLIGTSIIADDRRRSAALAILSATNRAVGNFSESGE